MKYLFAAAAGALAVLGFDPFGFFWAPVLSVAVLIWLWSGTTTIQSGWIGFCFGAGMFGLGVSWVYVSMHVYGNMPVWMASMVVAVFVSILSLYPALVGMVYSRFLRPSRFGLLLGLPSLWVLLEWIRGWFLSGFPWLSMGYSQADSVLIGIAPVLGVYGVSWVAVASAAAIYHALKPSGQNRYTAIGLLLALWLGGFALEQASWVEPTGEPLNVALVQGNVELTEKWLPDRRPEIARRYLSYSNGLEDRDLIVWPESALPYYIHQVDGLIWESMRRHPADFILGLLERAWFEEEVLDFNSAVALTDQDPQIYRKVHLVPFGEFLPLKPLLGWMINYLQIPMADFSPWPGSEQPPFNAAGVKVGMSICYEDAFSEEVLKALPTANILVNISEDAWFGDSFAPHQRIQMARMRAIETARPMLRAANTGVSAVIDHRGHILADSPQFVPGVVKATVQPMVGSTFYVRVGNYGIVLLSLVILGTVLALNRFTRE